MEPTFQNKNALNALPALWGERPREKAILINLIDGAANT
jgi:hypothetical protein